MKQFIYGAIVSAGLLAGSSAYALDLSDGGCIVQSRVVERNRNSRALLDLLSKTEECNEITMGSDGSIKCGWEKLVGGCGSDHLVTRRVHDYNIDDVLGVEGGLNQVILKVRSGNHDGLLRDIVYTFSDEKAAQRAAELFQAYRQNHLPTESSKTPPSSGKAVGNKY